MTRKYLLEQIDDAAVVQYYADGFEALSVDQRVLCWHLYSAAVAGRDIFYDQRHRDALAMREVLEEILVHHPAARRDAESGPVISAIRHYAKLFWINSGPYGSLSARKFVLTCSSADLAGAAREAERHGARFPYGPSETLDGLLERLRPAFFEPAHEPLVTCKNPAPGGDILAASANNLYHGVTMADLDGFEERYGLNSRLTKTEEGLNEEVYRVNGYYGLQISRVVDHLESALPYASSSLRTSLEALIRFYVSGERDDRVAADIAWVQDVDSAVGTVNGFVEVYLDARGVKGAWEALVYYVDQHRTRALERLADEAAWFEARLPVDPRWRREHVVGVSARAIEVIVETGEAGPMTAVGINLPNDEAIREQYGSKSISLTNIAAAYEQAQPAAFRQEFCWSADEIDRAERWGAAASEVTTAIHEVLGHGSGRVVESLEGRPQLALKEYYSALEEARADLVALYFIAEPRIAEIGLLPAADQQRVVITEYEAYARNALVQLRRVREGTTLEEDHMRNRQMIVHWLIDHTPAIDVRVRDGKTYFVVTDPDAFRAGAGRLLHDVQRIKSEGDYDAARSLFEAYGVTVDSSLRDEIVARVDRIHLPSYVGFVQPRLEPVVNEHGHVVDARMSYPLDLEQQMLEYSGKLGR